MDHRAKLLKALALLGSTNDGEALNAARVAHRLIGSLGLSWDDVIRFPAGTDNPPQTIRLHDGEDLAPPVGGTWLATVLWLCARRAGRDARENRALDRFAARWEKSPHELPTPHVALWIIDIHESLLEG